MVVARPGRSSTSLLIAAMLGWMLLPPAHIHMSAHDDHDHAAPAVEHAH